MVNGWLVTLVPYLKNRRTGNFSVRNPLLDDPGARVTTDDLPSGVSLVPFRCRWSGRDEDDAMEFLGGFLGATQDPSTLALRPKLGWAVRRGSALDQSLARLSGHDPAPPLDAPEFDRCIERLASGNGCELPGDSSSSTRGATGSVWTARAGMPPIGSATWGRSRSSKV